MEQKTILVGGNGFLERGMDAEHDGGVDEWIDVEASRRVGDSVLIMQKRQNHYGQFLKITEYAKRGRRSYVLIPKG
jgi:hypothetical protein